MFAIGALSPARNELSYCKSELSSDKQCHSLCFPINGAGVAVSTGVEAQSLTLPIIY